MSAFIFDFPGGSPSIHGGGDAGGGLIGIVDKLLDGASRALEPGGGFELLPGAQALGLNVHPSLVHFPIAMLTVFWLLDIFGSLFRRDTFRIVAGGMLYCGAVGALAAVAAGLYAASIVPHDQVVHEIMEWHQRLGITVATLAVSLSIWRLLAKGRIYGMANVLHLLLASLMVTCLVFGADMGGQMVYQHGVAVRALQASDAHHDHHHGEAAE